jgi:hypothetical protein
MLLTCFLEVIGQDTNYPNRFSRLFSVPSGYCLEVDVSRYYTGLSFHTKKPLNLYNVVKERMIRPFGRNLVNVP